MEEINARHDWIQEVQKVFLKADSGHDGLDVHEFQSYVQDEAVQAYFRRIGLNVEQDNAIALFELIDFDQDGKLDLDEFVEGCSQVVGQARQLDMARLKHETRVVKSMLSDIYQHLLHHQFHKHYDP